MTVLPGQREIALKIVLAGAADSGKLAILQAIGRRKGVPDVREYQVGPLRVYRLEWEESLGAGRKLHIVVQSLSGQVLYDAAEELLIRGADGLIFVADASPVRFRETWDALMRLGENARRNGFDLRSTPLALQYHQSQLEDGQGFDPRELDAKLGVPAGLIPRYVSDMERPDGEGMAFDAVFQQLRALVA